MAQFSKISVEEAEKPAISEAQRHLIMRYVLRKAIRLSAEHRAALEARKAELRGNNRGNDENAAPTQYLGRRNSL